MAITGAGGGIGRAVALAAAGEGARVVVADIGVSLDGGDPTSEVAEALVADIEGAGGEAVAVAESVTTLDGGEKIIGAGVERWGRIDGVVAVAGILRERMLFNMSEDEWDAVIETHLKGHFTVFRAAAAVMRKQEGGGSLVAFTSGAFAGSVAQANYAAAKGGIVSLVRSAAAGLSRYGDHRQRRCAGGPHPDDRPGPHGPGRERRSRGRRPAGRLPAFRPGQARHRSGLYVGGPEDRGVEPAPGGAGHVRRREVDPRRRSPPDWTRPWARNGCRSSTSSRSTGRPLKPRRPRRRTRDRSRSAVVQHTELVALGVGQDDPVLEAALTD